MCYAPTYTQILGIMNGTTNFMLTKMEGGADYGEVLAEAQALGFAEGKCVWSCLNGVSLVWVCYARMVHIGHGECWIAQLA